MGAIEVTELKFDVASKRLHNYHYLIFNLSHNLLGHYMLVQTTAIILQPESSAVHCGKNLKFQLITSHYASHWLQQNHCSLNEP